MKRRLSSLLPGGILFFSAVLLTGVEQSATTRAAWADCDSCKMILLPQAGSAKIDQQISQAQKQVKGAAGDPAPYLEKLGWLYVSKARLSNDPGYYKLAEQTALCLTRLNADAVEALLLRGHVFHSLHKFKEAEVLARQLVKKRGASFDFGLLGDVLMEQGALTEAVSAYQKMIDLKPDLHSYSRAAHLRWLKGDVEGAIELMKMAAQASSPLDPESAAWTHSRVAFYLFQTGRRAEAVRWVEAALKFQPDYPAALLLRGRIELADGKTPAAIEILSKACELNPLPEYQWLLADALAAAGRNAEVRELESRLEKRGASDDPRTFALFLATRDQQVGKALQLAKDELKSRADVFTHDALAWALWRSREMDAARREMQLALSEGTRDGRLFFHAAVIALEAGQNAEAADWQQKAEALQQMLFPSERQQLNQMKSRLAAKTGSNSVTAKLTAPRNTPIP